MDNQKLLLAYAIGICFVLSCYAAPNKEARFSIFQITKFANGPCKGDGTKNGTCYTEQECTDIGGTKSGKCADGFGVCCIKTIGAGEAASINGSFIVGGDTDNAVTPGSSYMYKVCPMSSDICRIRFDFTDFTLAAPVTAPGTLAAANAGLTAVQGVSIGDCVEDQFSITSTVGAGTPVICGTNVGQHMIVDSDGMGCSEVNINLGSSTTTTRTWDIQISQYQCGDDNGGPMGCLQYFNTAKGTIRSFNFPQQAAGAAVAVSVVHLSNQNYKACIRKPAGTNRICYPPCTSVDPAGAQSSFGVSVSPNAAARSANGADCVGANAADSDYLGIQGGDTNANAAAGTLGLVNRFCGRELLPARDTAWAAATTDATAVCTAQVPFELSVHFDGNEVSTANTDATTHEAAANPGGIIGFSLCYTTHGA